MAVSDLDDTTSARSDLYPLKTRDRRRIHARGSIKSLHSDIFFVKQYWGKCCDRRLYVGHITLSDAAEVLQVSPFVIPEKFVACFRHALATLACAFLVLVCPFSFFQTVAMVRSNMFPAKKVWTENRNRQTASVTMATALNTSDPRQAQPSLPPPVEAYTRALARRCLEMHARPGSDVGVAVLLAQAFEINISAEQRSGVFAAILVTTMMLLLTMMMMMMMMMMMIVLILMDTSRSSPSPPDQVQKALRDSLSPRPFSAHVVRLPWPCVDVAGASCSGLQMLLWVLSTRVGALLLTGRPVPFPAQSLAARHAVLKRWSTSRIGKFREAFQVSCEGCCRGWARDSCCGVCVCQCGLWSGREVKS